MNSQTSKYDTEFIGNKNSLHMAVLPNEYLLLYTITH
jgi:hypothetical protein